MGQHNPPLSYNKVAQAGIRFQHTLHELLFCSSVAPTVQSKMIGLRAYMQLCEE
jgi:hypothetical protein